MRSTRLFVTLLLLCTLASSAFAALSPEYANFAKGPVDLLLTPQERKAWSAVKTDDQAKKFVDLFWARRDPTPATPENEFRAEIEARIGVADAKFGTAKVRGSETDRGKTYIVLGSPTSMRRHGNPGGGTVQQPSRMSGDLENPTQGMQGGGLQQYGSREMWVYEQAKIDTLKLGQPVVQVGFLDQYNANEWNRERVQGTDYKSVFERAAAQYVTQPNLTEAPQFATAPAAPAAPAVVAAPATPNGTATGAISTEALRAAADAARASNASPDTLFLTTGEYITGDGEHFVPVNLYVTKSAGLTADVPVTFFGRVEPAAGGAAVLAFEEPVTLTASGDAFVFGRSLSLAPGSYQGTFGLARDGKPVAVVSRALTVQGLDKSAPSVSQLILSNNVYALSEAQLPTDPYAFGGLKVVPKGDLTFRQAEDLWYFIEARNPGLDPTTNQPNMTLKITVSGKTTEGKNVKMAGAASAAQAIEIKGVANHYGLGQAMPLATFKPGEYTIAVQVKDQVLDKSYDLKESFRVVQ